MTGRKPVPLQAGHISSTVSDFIFIGFIKRATPAINDQIDNYTSHKLRNQLWGVTLNEKVKLTRLDRFRARLDRSCTDYPNPTNQL